MMHTLLQSAIFWLGFVATIFTAIEGTRLWFEERRKLGGAAKWKMLTILVTTICTIGSLAASNLSQSKSEAKAQASEKALLEALTNFGGQAEQFGRENQELRSQLNERMTALGGQLDQNVKVMGPRWADLTFGFLNYADKTF